MQERSVYKVITTRTYLILSYPRSVGQSVMWRHTRLNKTSNTKEKKKKKKRHTLVITILPTYTTRGSLKEALDRTPPLEIPRIKKNPVCSWSSPFS